MESDLYLNNLRCWNSIRNRFHKDSFPLLIVSDCHMAAASKCEEELLYIDHILNSSHIIDVYGFFFSENCLWSSESEESNRKLNDKCQSDLYRSRMAQENVVCDGQTQPAIEILFSSILLVLEELSSIFCGFTRHFTTSRPTGRVKHIGNGNLHDLTEIDTINYLVGDWESLLESLKNLR